MSELKCGHGAITTIVPWLCFALHSVHSAAEVEWALCGHVSRDAIAERFSLSDRRKRSAIASPL